MVAVIALLIFVLTFVLAAVTVLIASAVMERQPVEGPVEADVPLLLKQETLSSISVWDALLTRFDFVEGLQLRISQAGLDWSVGRVTAMMLLIGTFSLAVLSGLKWLPMVLALVLSAIAAVSPYFYILRRRSKRFDLIEEQLPEALDFLARALRAGHPFSVTLELLSNENAPPLSAEMKIVSDERKLGRSWDEALRSLTARVPLLNIRLFVAAVVLQTRTGGKLSEVVAQLAETMRESAALRGEARAISAHGRMTGLVLTVLPLGIAAMMTFVNPAYLGTLFEHPVGQYLIAGSIVSLIAAHLVIQRIVTIKI